MNDNQQRKYAYVTVISSIDYLDGVRTLLYSLQKVNSRYPLVVLVSAGFDVRSRKAIECWGGRCSRQKMSV